MDCEKEVDTLAKQIDEPLPKSDRIPNRLMKVIWKATEKEQSKRFQTAMEFKRAILEALEPEPSLGEKISTWIQGNVVTMVAIAAVVAFLIFVIVLLII